MKRKRILWVALAQERGSTNVALPHLINVTIKTNHKLCVHYNASQGTAWHLDNHVEFLITKKEAGFYVPWSLRIAALLDSFGRERGNCIGNKAKAQCCTYIHSGKRHRNRVSQWRRSIHRAGLSWSVAGGEHTPAVSVGKEKKIAFITEGGGLSGRGEAETESVIHFQIHPRG